MTLSVLREGFFLVLLISGVPLVVCAAVGLVVSFVQAVTQIQEQTLTFLLKLIPLSVTVFLFSHVAFLYLVRFIQRSILSMSQ